MRQVLLSSIVAAMVIVGVSCGSGDGGDSSEAAARSPIAEFLGEEAAFGFGIDDDEAAQAAFEVQERAREEAVAACMKEQGFDYIPVDPPDISFFETEDGLEYGSEEWTAKYGFGITTQWFSQDEVGPDLVGHEGFVDDETYEDPNQEIVEALSQAEQDAYNEALYGNEDDFIVDDRTLSEEETEAHFEDYEPSGCYGETFAEDGMNRFYTEFSDEIDEMYERMQTDPRVVESEKETATCVAGKGLEFTSMDDAYELFEPELSALHEEVGYPGQDLTEADFEAMTPEELEALYDQGLELSPEVKARLAELQDKEITLAKAVFDCGGGPDEQIDLYNEVRIEYEERFLEDNADRLAEFQANAE